jgi:hypothetical protein
MFTLSVKEAGLLLDAVSPIAIADLRDKLAMRKPGQHVIAVVGDGITTYRRLLFPKDGLTLFRNPETWRCEWRSSCHPHRCPDEDQRLNIPVKNQHWVFHMRVFDPYRPDDRRICRVFKSC